MGGFFIAYHFPVIFQLLFLLCCQLIYQHENFKDMLSTRSKNGIARCFGYDVLDTPEVIATAGSTRLRMTPQLGPKSLQEIAELLYDYGYIECSHKWTGNKMI